MVLLNRNSLPTGGLRCRQIDEADIEAVASFLAHGFPAHDRGFWRDAFARLTKHEPPPDFPKYGYLLESDRVVVGAILLICSTLPGGRRCHDPLQSFELVCRTALSPLCAYAGVAGIAR